LPSTRPCAHRLIAGLKVVKCKRFLILFCRRLLLRGCDESARLVHPLHLFLARAATAARATAGAATAPRTVDSLQHLAPTASAAAPAAATARAAARAPAARDVPALHHGPVCTSTAAPPALYVAGEAD
jgi:hypothetical protein